MKPWREVLLEDGDCINAFLQKLDGDRAGWVLATSVQCLSSPTFFLDLAFAILLADVLVHFLFTTFSDRCLGSSNDEGRSEV